MKWSPKVVYNAITVLFTISQRPWGPRSRGIGGYDESAAGVPESYRQRRDEELDIILRFYENQINDVMTWLAWAQDNAGTTFKFYLESTDAIGAAYDVYLVDPVMGDDIKPERSAQYPKTYEITVRLRTANGVRITRAYL